MPKQLNVRSDEAYRLAHAIARETGRPLADVVVTALRKHGESLPKRENMTPAQRATYDGLMALARETARRKKPGATSDHGDLYDEFGLPI
ncbi:MAG: type II toxin-antitoxin system VapB family antitoxin [Parvularculaceae bacterium]